MERISTEHADAIEPALCLAVRFWAIADIRLREHGSAVLMSASDL